MRGNRKEIDEELVEEVYDRTKAACEKYQYKCTRVFDEIHIKTFYEEWFFVPAAEKIRLMHAGVYGRSGATYHEQFRKEITPEEIVRYVHKHELAKYTPKRVRVTEQER